MNTAAFEVHPLSPDRWPDLVQLFGPRGACGGCWCMWWRLSRSEYDEMKGDVNRQAFEEIVRSGEAPGLLLYAEGQPAGWCSIGPREDFPALERSRILKRVDEEPVWSVVCFFIEKSHRCQGLTVRLLQAALDYAARNGAKIIEGYPHDEAGEKAPEAFVFTGLVGAFREAGFQEVARRSPKRPVMRYYIGTQP